MSDNDSYQGLPDSAGSGEESDGDISFVSSASLAGVAELGHLGTSKQKQSAAIDLKAAAQAYYSGIGGGKKKAQSRVHFDDSD